MQLRVAIAARQVCVLAERVDKSVYISVLVTCHFQMMETLW
jgi:hypothetical protein